MQAFFLILALANLANGAWMLFAPGHWFVNLPAAVPDTGPFNAHLVRDVGAAFATIGMALLAAAGRPAARRPVLLATTTFYVLHALLHVDDILTGRLPSTHWAIDFPGVFLPAALLVALCLPRFWPEPGRR